MGHRILVAQSGALQSYLSAVRGSIFLRHNAIVFVGSVLVGVGNYIYYPILGRLLAPAAFGEVQALTALFMQLTIFLVVLGQVTVNIVANYTDEGKKQTVLFELERLALIISIVLFVILGALSWKLKAFFQFESTLPFILLLLAVVVSVPVAFRSAFLRAHKRFASASIAQLIGAFGKIALSVGLVLLGLESAGAMGGIVLAQLLMLGYAAYMARRLGWFRPSRSAYGSRPKLALLLPELKYALLVLVGSVAITLISTIDVFVVKHYFDPHTAGEYAGISTVAKIIFFLTASVTQVLLPSVRIAQSKRQNRSYLLKSLVLLLVIGGGATAIIMIFARIVVSVLMGANYLMYVSLLPQLSIVMFLLSIINLLIAYYLALRNYQVGIVMALGTCLVSALMIARHDSLLTIVNNLLYSSIGILLLFLAWRILHLTLIRRTASHA
jgi:O-antigen/teichoic acid export membrane protein